MSSNCCRLAEEERKRLAIEVEEFKHIKEKFISEFEKAKKPEELQEEWNKFISCSKLPDIDSESDINSYLSIWKDNPNFNKEDRNVKSDFEDIKMGIEVM